MAARTNPTTLAEAPATASNAGILRPDRLARHVELVRAPADPSVERWVENHWALRWDLPEGVRFPSQVVPHPTVSLTAEFATHPRAGFPPGGPVVLTGSVTRRFDVEVEGRGRVVGLRFRPGGLAALTGRSARDLVDRVVPARRLLPPRLCAALADRDLAEDLARWGAVADAGLADLAAEADPRHAMVLDIVADMLQDRSLVKVEAVAARHGFTTRTLQRLFAHYVGVGPKQVLARYRMHDAITDLDGGDGASIADLAVRYGWYDQAHFTRDFTALVGLTPAQYRDRPRT